MGVVSGPGQGEWFGWWVGVLAVVSFHILGMRWKSAVGRCWIPLASSSHPPPHPLFVPQIKRHLTKTTRYGETQKRCLVDCLTCWLVGRLTVLVG